MHGAEVRECKQAHIRGASEHTGIQVRKLKMANEPTSTYVGRNTIIILTRLQIDSLRAE